METLDIKNLENLSIEDIEKTLKQLKKILFKKLVEELNLTEKDLEEFEKVREIVWKEEKKRLGL